MMKMTNILYSTSDATIVNLIQIHGYPLSDFNSGAYRKFIDICPYCDHRASWEEWFRPPSLKEISFALDNYSWGTSNIEEKFALISECQGCGEKSIIHEKAIKLLEYDWLNHDEIKRGMDIRGIKY